MSGRWVVAPWRVGPSWSPAALRDHLDRLADRPANYDGPPEGLTPERGWTVDRVAAPIARESPGPPLPDGPYARARRAFAQYAFSDPRLVRGHFDRAAPLLGRTMLLEARVLWLRFLVGVRVAEAREERGDDRTRFVSRFDALEGHVVRGAEWFVLAKDHRTGTVSFTIEAHWRPGRLPTWWSDLGFRWVGGAYRALWRHQAIRRLRGAARSPLPDPASRAR